MQTTTPEVRRRWGHDLQQIIDKGTKGLRSYYPDVESISKTDPQYITKREEILDVLTRAKIITDMRWDAAVENSQRGALRKQAEKDAREEESRRAYAKAATNPLKAFPALGIAEIAVRDSGGHVVRCEPAELKRGLQNGVPVLAVNEGFVVVSVPEADAAALAKRYDFPKTMEWTSGNRHCWAFSDMGYEVLGLIAGGIAGNKLEVASVRFGGCTRLVFAEIDNARWIVTPKQVELTDDGMLPASPEKLCRIIDAVKGAAPKAIDQAVLD